ncbi:MAG TPA: peptidase T [Pyrinomonadaceae bacterium]|nr:peptidase T [Pyrinomonadaceae bacterium]HRK50290.1 peptidase T [Pyrinomonadaceae bacterium]
MKFLFTVVITIAFAAGSLAQIKAPAESAMDRFLRYVKIDTQAVEEAGKVPSSDKQWNLARLLEKELKALGVQNVRISEHAIVYGLVPGNLPDNSKVPTIGFIAHMDTSPAVSGENVNAIIHKNYQGGDIVLPNDKTQVITVEKNPALKELIGDDIITADGTTLLGSDDKSGIAEIMTMIDILRNNPQFKHGNIAVAFTPDEEVGGGIDKFDVKGFGAKYAYTVDGGELGEISDETWTAKTATITFSGKSTHPGYAKDILVNSSFAAADYLSRFNDPKVPRPETTEGRVGFVHPYNSTLDIETSVVRVLLRNFEMSGVDEQEAMLRRMLDDTMKRFPNVAAKFDIRVGYLNMKEELKKYPQLVQFASDAAKRAGVTPKMKPIRGGTDGARLTFMGLPTPNLFTGGHNFHGKLEWNSRKGLERSTETLVNLVQIWAEKGGN